MTGHRVPPPDDVTEAWWAATSRHELTVQSCPTCGTHQHPPRALCTGCGALDASEFERVVGPGVVDACTVVHRAPRPGVEAPYVVARVRIADVIMLTQLVGREPQEWSTGDSVAVQWIDLPDGRALPVFGPWRPASQPTQ